MTKSEAKEYLHEMGINPICLKDISENTLDFRLDPSMKLVKEKVQEWRHEMKSAIDSLFIDFANSLSDLARLKHDGELQAVVWSISVSVMKAMKI